GAGVKADVRVEGTWKVQGKCILHTVSKSSHPGLAPVGGEVKEHVLAIDGARRRGRRGGGGGGGGGRGGGRGRRSARPGSCLVRGPTTAGNRAWPARRAGRVAAPGPRRRRPVRS